MRKLSPDSFPHLMTTLLDRLRGGLSAIISQLLAAYWRIQLGRSCKFYGLPLFRRIPGSRIVIGDKCEFRSAHWSNYAGINHPCILATLSEGAVIQIDSNSGFSGAVVAAMQSVSIGKRVMVGANSSISDTDWHPVDPVRRAALELGDSSPVRIEDDVWLGANVVVLKGVTIGKGSTVAANSVVTKSIPPGVVAAGAPARVISEISQREPVSGKVSDEASQQ